MDSKLLGQIRSYAINAWDHRFRPDELVQVNKTPYRIIFQDGLMCLRFYAAHGADSSPTSSQAEGKADSNRLPLLFIPPLGVPAWIFDLMQDRSLVRFFSSLGWDVYLIDWGSPGPLDSSFDLQHYVTHWLPQAVVEASEHAAHRGCGGGNDGPGVSLAGYCMGGLLALMYLGARSDDPFSRALPGCKRVRNLVTIGSPVDFHDTSGSIGKLVNAAVSPLKAIERKMPMLVEHLGAALPGRYFHVPGRVVSQAFSLTQPLNRFTSSLGLLWNLADRSYVVQHTALSRWFDDMLDYPGGVVRNMLFDLVGANRLKRGGIRLNGYQVDLKHVQANLLAIIGKTDRLVSPQAAASIMALVGSKDKSLLEASGGHAGVFAGHKAMRETWQPIDEWLSARSKP